MSNALKARHARPATAGGVFALRGRDRPSLIAALERITALAPRLSHHELHNLGHHLSQEVSHGRSSTLAEDGEIRIALTASNGDQLAERACHAARLVRTVRGGPLVREAGIHLSCGARGRVVLVFASDAVAEGTAPGGSAWATAEAATLARSLDGLRWLEGLGDGATGAVGHGLGEIAGLVWAGSLSAGEAARLTALHTGIRRGLGGPRTAMVRVAADEATVSALRATCGLAVAAEESSRSYVLAGPAAGVRELTRQAAALGVTASVLNAAHALHTPAMAPCAAPLRSVLARVRFGTPRRRLVSTVTARELTPQDDIAAILCAQLTSVVRFREALRVAAGGADLIVVADAGEALIAASAGCGIPAVGFPAGRPDAAATGDERGYGRPMTGWLSTGSLTGGWLTGSRLPDGDAGDCAAALFAAGAMAEAAAPAPGPAGLARIRPADGGPAGTEPAEAGAADGQTAENGPGSPGAAEIAGRFMENVTMLRPGAELEAEARISVRTDPYLADYLLDGEAALPAAIALEAMAQAASVLGGRPARSVRRVRFGAPVVIPAGDAHDDGADGAHDDGAHDDGAGRETVLRIRARAGADGVETVLRAGSGGEFAECARAVFVGSGEAATAAPRAGGAARAEAGAGGRSGDMAFLAGAEIVDGTDLYGAVCFQTGRFRRVALVAGKPPRSCRAIVRGRDEAAWFGPLQRPAGRLVLGSPGLNDAPLQVAQACVPQRRLLPGGCDSLTVTGDEVPGAVELRAFLISAAPGAGEYVWDVHGYDQDGQLVMAWIGLRMRDAGPLPGSSLPCSSGRWSPGHCSPADADLFLPDGQPVGVAAQLEAVRPAPVPQQQIESLSRAR